MLYNSLAFPRRPPRRLREALDAYKLTHTQGSVLALVVAAFVLPLAISNSVRGWTPPPPPPAAAPLPSPFPPTPAPAHPPHTPSRYRHDADPFAPQPFFSPRAGPHAFHGGDAYGYAAPASPSPSRRRIGAAGGSPERGRSPKRLGY